jgi:FtsP/CotA-like multicopper oxidase with cupredoxin domain
MSSDGSYRTRVVIPSNHQPGVDWYHAHRHGYVADQVYGGLAGTLQIGDPLDPWPQYKGKYVERVLALTLGMVATDKPTGDRYLIDPGPTDSGALAPYGTTWRKYVNGQYNPVITIRPGETQIWSFADMARNGNFNLGITDGNAQNPWQSTIFSYDGNTNNVMPRKQTLVPPVPFNYNGPTVVDPGERTSMAVTAPTKPGTYYIIDNEHQRLKPQDQFWALATIHVEGEPATQPPPNLTPTGPVPDLYTVMPDQQRTFQWSAGSNPNGTTNFAINGFVFPESPIVPIQVGQVEQWLLVSTSGVDHVFHIHQTDIAIIKSGSSTISTSPAATGPYRYTSLRDSIDIPPASSVIIRFRVSPELGKYVFHCHILPHEDGGMMMAVIAVPNERQRRFALGSIPGQQTLLVVRDGDGHRLGTLNPDAKTSTRGVSTAAGELTSDMTEDVVAAPSTPGSAPFISVYDGQSPQRIAHFRPFGNQRVGVSLAVGNIDDQGQAEIIAGRVGRGPSLVRIFRPDGSLVRELQGTLPGVLPNGVNVASSDFDGDNFDDVAIGGGRGADPLVVGLSGLALSSGASEQLFSFTAAGGPKAGVNLVGGYYDPTTRPGFVGNLVTTPASGRVAGWTQVWVPYTPNHEDPTGPSMLPPHQIASFRPLGRHTDRPLSLQVSRLGHNGLDALAAWLDPRKAVYVSIDDAGVISRIQTPIPAGGTAKTTRLKAPNMVHKSGYKLELHTRTGVTLRITRHGKPVRNASVGVTYTMMDMPMAPSSGTLRQAAPGVYTGSGPAFVMPGRWQVAVRVVPRGHDPFTARLVSVLRPATGR